MSQRAISERFQFWRRILSGWLALLALLSSAPVLSQEGGPPPRAGVVVVHGDGSYATRCVTFAGDGVTGMALIQQSGLALVANAGPTGSTVCKLDGEGCAETDCFCECKGTPCFYWNYYHLSGGAWAYSGMGAAAWTLKNGDVDAWVWGDGNTALPALTFDQICPAGESASVPAATITAPPATPAAAPTTTPSPVATATPPPATTAPAAPTSPPPAPATATTTPSPTPPPPATANPAATAVIPAAATLPPAELRITPSPSELLPPLTPSASAGAPSENRRSYMVFGILVLILGGGYFIVQRRRP